MTNLFRLLIPCLLAGLVSCTKGGEPPIVEEALYFPPVGSAEWQTQTPASLGWNESELNALYPYLESKGTKGFIILKNGKIAVERYFGTFTRDSSWYWASAGKTMTAFLVGIAQKEGFLNIANRSSQYLGAGWTSLPLAKENLITVRHQLTMTTGLDDGTGDVDCTLPSCLQFKADAGNRWAYHNAPYTLLEKVVESATGQSYNIFYQQKVRNPIGMNGGWVQQGYNNVLYSTPRSMARFGLLLLNKGIWGTTPILNDPQYYTAQVSSSQSLNNSYGYLTWLNGKSSYMVPTVQAVFNGSMITNAPSDMFAGLGKNDQKVYVVPSQKLVVIRMGNAADGSFNAVSGFDQELWGKLKSMMRGNW